MGCLNIFFNMKCGYFFFFSCFRFIFIVCILGFWSMLFRLMIFNVLFLWIIVIFLFCRYIILFVYFIIGVVFEVRKNLFFFIFIISGLFLCVVIILLGLFLLSIVIVYVLIILCRVNWMVVSKFKWLESWKNLINCMRILVFVLFLKMNFFFCSFFFRVV